MWKLAYTGALFIYDVSAATAADTKNAKHFEFAYLEANECPRTRKRSFRVRAYLLTFMSKSIIVIG